MGVNFFREAGKTALHPARLERASLRYDIGTMSCLAFIDLLAHVSVTLVVVGGYYGAIDRYFMKIWTAQTDELGVVYENKRPCNKGSLVKSIPGTTCPI